MGRRDGVEPGAELSSTRTLQVAFVASGVAGLVYEVLWSRYLGLFVGHGAYAQVLVLAVYLGGMALGSLVVADLSRRVARPLVWYARVEAALALFGLVFHPLFVLVTGLGYDHLFPALGTASLVGSARWALAGLLILPQAMLLGATFPLMAAGMVRRDAGRPGRGVARVYLLNTLGGAAGVLLAGFWLIGSLGYAGTSMMAAALNLVAAGLAYGFSRAEPAKAPEPVTAGAVLPGTERASTADEAAPAWARRPAALVAVMLAVSFGTALASFTYEIGWIRLLSLVLGSATHAFELMLSAFILGLALGAWWIEDRTDRARDPLRLLGGVQVLMGIAALLSIPLFYWISFDVVARMVQELPGRPVGYALFNLGRYGLCLLVMLPSTVLAGMTLPVITGSLLRSGAGEAAIGRVYGANTIGSVAGAGIAGLLALPLLGAKGLIVAGAALDIALGLWLLERSVRWAQGRVRVLAGAAAAGLLLLVGVQYGVRMSDVVLGSGVFRSGSVPGPGEWQSLYHEDGRTATISAYIGTGDGVTVLATNGKPDASLEPLFRVEGRDTLPARPLREGADFTTQVLAPMVALAHRPEARTVANIGHGSGMSAASFLTSERLTRLVTIEIEPLVVEASVVFLPANDAAFSDPRSSYVFDDAKSFFSYRQERFDIIFAEPSNPWVSGTASLFTREFYARVKAFLVSGGILTQWVQIYELDDELFLSILAALDSSFPSYRAYLVGDSDVAIVASAEGPLPEADWSVLGAPGFRAITAGLPAFEPEHLRPLFMFDQSTFRALLDGGVAANSDFHPLLDVRAERARFERRAAEGAYSFADSRVRLQHLLVGERVEPGPFLPVPARGLAPAVFTGRAAWLRGAYAAGGGIAPEEWPEWQNELLHLQAFLELGRGDDPVLSWEAWAAAFERAEVALHFGTVGWAEPAFYEEAYGYLDRVDAPPEARAAVDLHHALARFDGTALAAAADVLVPRVAAGEQWVSPETLLDAAVLGYLEVGRADAASDALEALVPRTGRKDHDLRNRLLAALVEQEGRADSSAPPSSTQP